MNLQPDYIKLLSPEERVTTIKAGMELALMNAGLQKDAQAGITVRGIGQAAVILTLMTGIPLGIASHIVGKKIGKRQIEEQELGAKTKYYQQAAKDLEQGLSGLQ